jgi:hypothetical protein
LFHGFALAFARRPGAVAPQKDLVMPLVRSALIATAACLIGAAAYAQPASTDTAPPAGDSQSMPQNPPPASSDMNAGGPASGAADTTTAPIGAAANTSATVATDNQVIASQPVPDTPANRAQYGKPMSRAGKRTAPAGN